MCLIPLFVHDRRVSCGKCPECLRACRSDWIYRLDQESRIHSHNYFCTLTFRNEDLPPTEAVAFELFQKFRKKLNRELGQIPYFVTLERGEQFDRFHLHVIFYRDAPLQKSLIRHLWRHGFIKMNSLTPKRVRYCASYMFKNDMYNKVRLYRSSNNLGGIPAVPYRIRCVKGRPEPVPLPRYYRKKFPAVALWARQYFDSKYHNDDPDYVYDLCASRYSRLRAGYRRKRITQSYESFLLSFLAARVRKYRTWSDPRDLIAFPGPAYYRGLSRSYSELLRRVDARLALLGDRRSGNLQRYLMVDCPMSLRERGTKIRERVFSPPDAKKMLVRPKIQLTFIRDSYYYNSAEARRVQHY